MLLPCPQEGIVDDTMHRSKREVHDAHFPQNDFYLRGSAGQQLERSGTQKKFLDF
jgi:hypothetical protein